MKRKRTKKSLNIIIILCAVGIAFAFFKGRNLSESIPIEQISAFKVSENTIDNLIELSEKYQINFAKLLTIYMVQNNFFEEKLYVDENIERMLVPDIKSIEEKCNKEFSDYFLILDNIINDIKKFPIESDSGYVYSDSWGAERTYGGKRIHQGCDIIDKENICGRIRIISMTDGVVENIGWNEKGGWRIGIRSENGNYYYYAHLSEYSKEFFQGDKIKAGDILGFMGDSGYGEEGTTGKFVVHLHIGICVNTNISKDEFWINPYPFLIYAEANEQSEA